MGGRPGYEGRTHWTSTWKNTSVGVLKGNVACEFGMIVCGGEFAFAYQHPAWVCEVHKEVGALMAKYIETKHDDVSGTSKSGIEGRNQDGDGGSTQGNTHSFHDGLLDKPDG